MLYVCFRDFLGRDTVAELIDYVRRNEARFEPTQVTDGITSQVNPETRRSSQLDDLGGFKDTIERRVLDMAPWLVNALGVPQFEPDGVEMELVAHGDGAVYLRHIDILTGAGHALDADRVITAVYYFHREPKSFAGGTLRLHALARAAKHDASAGMDIEPQQDSLVAFSSGTLHEVLKVSCDSRMFMDSRFAINCWILKARRAT